MNHITAFVKSRLNQQGRDGKVSRRRTASVVAVAGLVAAGAAGASLFAASGATEPEQVAIRPGDNHAKQSQHLVGSSQGSSLGTSNFMFRQAAQVVTVPAHAATARITLAGGQGGNRDVNTTLWKSYGQGAVVTGTLAVTPGDKVTVAIGQHGAPPNGNKNPGAGGWALDSYYAGGNGGSGHGSQTHDGGGGGAASTVSVDDRVVVVAAGGGGEGGATTEGSLDWGIGGGGGDGHGQTGMGNGFSLSELGGYGGSEYHQDNDKSGGSYSGALLKGGGGGGGGGRWAGGGGQPSGLTRGGGGGGGSSLHDRLTDVQVSSILDAPGLGNLGDGYASITWYAADNTNVSYAFEKTDAANSQLLEVHGSGNTEAGGVVDTWRRTRKDDTVLANQRWTYSFEGTKSAGVIRNQDSNLCLQVNGTDGKIDQWPCDDDTSNHLWTIVSHPGGDNALMVDLDQDMGPWSAGKYYLATKEEPDSTGDGAALTLITNVDDDRTQWLPQQLN